MASNPYEFQETTAVDSAAIANSGAIQELIQTRPWVRLMGILGLIGAGFMVLAACGMVLMGLASDARGTGFAVGFGALYLLFACLYVYPSFKLMAYGRAITTVEETGSAADLADALGHQRAFWRFIGIAATVILVVYLLVFVGAFVGAFALS